MKGKTDRPQVRKQLEILDNHLMDRNLPFPTEVREILSQLDSLDIRTLSLFVIESIDSFRHYHDHP